MMKKRTMILVLGCLLATACSQVSINSLYNSYSREDNVEKVKINGLVMALAKPFMGKEARGFKISGIEVLSLDDCSPEVKERFNRQALNFKDKDYELFVNSSEENEKTRIYLKFGKDFIREIVIITIGDEPSLVHLKGKIKPSDIEKLSNGRR
ncbi:MAG: DUF4252 domain-containing protein [Dysgonamonadaceae bacterium]|jgi:hypothetical protein|nr:DUF4252 domain-containing protein [Dysgonamonadaceae bacterium]